ncbi:hypothetical protein B0H11DRAFT_2085331 [Mycena galericulata]|nr:hypothetical protein B0H11DRAFT_2085331 [Mycena galericulata]
MLSLRPQSLAFLCLFHCLFLALVPTNAVPLSHRQAGLQAATTVMTQSTTSTAAGDMTQTCVIALTPITDSNGNPAVQEVRTCTVTMGPVDNGSSFSNSTGSSSDSSDSSNSTTTDSSTTDSSTSTDTTGSSTDTSSASATSTAAAGGAAVANGVSSVAASASATGTDSASADATSTASSVAGGGAAAISANAISMIPASAAATVAANAVATPPAVSAAAENASSASASASAFVVPGQTLQVLPIGLGVFAGISVIALIVVGLVTYERTKYRKAFRARKLAESGAGMGYGGMAQR